MMLDSKLKVENLMNLVMQFKKVCNHPELFERRPVQSPFFMAESLSPRENNLTGFNQMKEVYFSNNNPIV